MTNHSTKSPVLGSDAEIAVGLLDEWFDPIEAGLRDRVRERSRAHPCPPASALLQRRAALQTAQGQEKHQLRPPRVGRPETLLFHSVVLPSAVSSLARGIAISTRPKVPSSERDR
jgi:hypothetical protein